MPMHSPSGETVSDVGEFGLIGQVTRALEMGPAVSIGPGDDAAVFLVNGSAVCSTDLLVEDQHFRRAWSSAAEIGRKAVAVNVADLEAMGATPVAMVIGLGLPGDTEARWVRELSTGVREEAALAGISLVGGDMTAARDVTIGVTVIGQTDGVNPVTREGARPGDAVAIVGRLGWAAAGLAVLQRGFRSPRAVVEAQRVPRVPYGQGRRAALAGAHAMCDVSDGLLADLGHIAEASGVCIDVDSARVEVSQVLQTVGAATGIDPMTFVLGGGEDHALVATFPLGQVPADWQVIGRVVDDGAPGDVLVDGAAWEGPRGWDHFAR